MTNVVNLTTIREMLNEWERVRLRIISGDVSGFQAALMSLKRDETLHAAGCYVRDSNLAARASLRMSAARMMVEDQPLSPQSRTRHY